MLYTQNIQAIDNGHEIIKLIGVNVLTLLNSSDKEATDQAREIVSLGLTELRDRWASGCPLDGDLDEFEHYVGFLSDPNSTTSHLVKLGFIAVKGPDDPVDYTFPMKVTTQRFLNRINNILSYAEFLGKLNTWCTPKEPSDENLDLVNSWASILKDYPLWEEFPQDAKTLDSLYIQHLHKMKVLGEAQLV